MSFYTFKPIYQKRLWGGTNLNRLFQRYLPPNEKIGESWELVDRSEACSEVHGATADLLSLHDLWTQKREAVFGSAAPNTERFPILIKLLDCNDVLSVQVHPPASQAAALQGEPKTEMWYFLDTTEEAKIFVGLKKGVTRAQFEAAIGTPKLADCLFSRATRPGEAMFLPSGRVHAIGAGNVILEIQQNSDTTYRVDDWGRVEADGKPRELHVAQAKASIKYDDFEPYFAQPHGERVLVCEYFTVLRSFLFPEETRTWFPDKRSFQYQFVSKGEITFDQRTFKAGEAFLVSADHPDYDLTPGSEGTELITVEWGRR